METSQIRAKDINKNVGHSGKRADSTQSNYRQDSETNLKPQRNGSAVSKKENKRSVSSIAFVEEHQEVDNDYKCPNNTCISLCSETENSPPLPTPRSIGTNRSTSESSTVPEFEYLQFSLRITEDIIRNDLYTNKEMQRVFNSHIEANRGRLSMKKMLEQINLLCKELNIGKNETTQNSKLLTQKNTKKKNKNHEKGDDISISLENSEIVNQLLMNKKLLTDDEIQKLNDNDLQDVINKLLNTHDSNDTYENVNHEEKIYSLDCGDLLRSPEMTVEFLDDSEGNDGHKIIKHNLLASETQNKEKFDFEKYIRLNFQRMGIDASVQTSLDDSKEKNGQDCMYNIYQNEKQKLMDGIFLEKNNQKQNDENCVVTPKNSALNSKNCVSFVKICESLMNNCCDKSAIKNCSIWDRSKNWEKLKNINCAKNCENSSKNVTKQKFDSFKNVSKTCDKSKNVSKICFSSNSCNCSKSCDVSKNVSKICGSLENGLEIGNSSGIDSISCNGSKNASKICDSSKTCVFQENYSKIPDNSEIHSKSCNGSKNASKTYDGSKNASKLCDSSKTCVCQENCAKIPDNSEIDSKSCNGSNICDCSKICDSSKTCVFQENYSKIPDNSEIDTKSCNGSKKTSKTYDCSKNASKICDSSKTGVCQENCSKISDKSEIDSKSCNGSKSALKTYDCSKNVSKICDSSKTCISQENCSKIPDYSEMDSKSCNSSKTNNCSKNDSKICNNQENVLKSFESSKNNFDESKKLENNFKKASKNIKILEKHNSSSKNVSKSCNSSNISDYSKNYSKSCDSSEKISKTDSECCSSSKKNSKTSDNSKFIDNSKNVSKSCNNSEKDSNIDDNSNSYEILPNDDLSPLQNAYDNKQIEILKPLTSDYFKSSLDNVTLNFSEDISDTFSIITEPLSSNEKIVTPKNKMIKSTSNLKTKKLSIFTKPTENIDDQLVQKPFGKENLNQNKKNIAFDHKSQKKDEDVPEKTATLDFSKPDIPDNNENVLPDVKKFDKNQCANIDQNVSEAPENFNDGSEDCENIPLPFENDIDVIKSFENHNFNPKNVTIVTRLSSENVSNQTATFEAKARLCETLDCPNINQNVSETFKNFNDSSEGCENIPLPLENDIDVIKSFENHNFNPKNVTIVTRLSSENVSNETVTFEAKARLCETLEEFLATSIVTKSNKTANNLTFVEPKPKFLGKTEKIDKNGNFELISDQNFDTSETRISESTIVQNKNFEVNILNVIGGDSNQNANFPKIENFNLDFESISENIEQPITSKNQVVDNTSSCVQSPKITQSQSDFRYPSFLNLSSLPQESENNINYKYINYLSPIAEEDFNCYDSDYEKSVSTSRTSTNSKKSNQSNLSHKKLTPRPETNQNASKKSEEIDSQIEISSQFINQENLGEKSQKYADKNTPTISISENDSETILNPKLVENAIEISESSETSSISSQNLCLGSCDDASEKVVTHENLGTKTKKEQNLSRNSSKSILIAEEESKTSCQTTSSTILTSLSCESTISEKLVPSENLSDKSITSVDSTEKSIENFDS